MINKREFNGKYSPFELDQALYNFHYNDPFDITTLEGKPLGRHGIEVLDHFYKAKTRDGALIIRSSTDIEGGTERTIYESLTADNDVKNEIARSIAEKKPIIIPVAENRKILGFIPRKHWVTLCYDPIKNEATIIDSKSRWRSFLYPTKSMITMLKNGLLEVFRHSSIENKPNLNTITVKTICTGAQKDDIHCGAWTLRHIIDIATTGKVNSPHYSKKDKDDVVKWAADLAGVKMTPKKSLLARLFSRIFGSRSKTTDVEDHSASNSETRSDDGLEVVGSYTRAQNKLETRSPVVAGPDDVEVGPDPVEVGPDPVDADTDAYHTPATPSFKN